VVALFMRMPLFRPRSVRQGQFLLAAIQQDLVIEDGLRTLHPILEHITWSANIALEGTYPFTRYDGGPLTASKQKVAGTPLAAGRRFCCSEIKGDWKWLEKVLRLLPTPVSKKLCYMCDACSDDSAMKYYDTGDAQQMALVSLGYFGDPAILETQQLLDVAFSRFKEWRLRHRIPCSQKRFNVGLIIKKQHGHYMTAKAYNGRVILEWLSDVTREVVQEGRLQDPRLPLLAVAMKLREQYP
ncbi:unnamed protein product, partial [Symbiodinium sp. CCMP2456]